MNAGWFSDKDFNKLFDPHAVFQTLTLPMAKMKHMAPHPKAPVPASPLIKHPLSPHPMALTLCPPKSPPSQSPVNQKIKMVTNNF